jgi:ubiquitin-conjugating enzyme E2 variant
MMFIEIIITVLIADFVSGFFHWLEDAYGNESWPVTGRLVTRPNTLHHHDPRHFTQHTWWESSWDLLCLGVVVLLITWATGLLTWHIWLFVALGVNANQIHKWAHQTRAENGPFITALQRLRLLQTPRHHARHHTDPKNSHYCVLTDFLNPVLDRIGFWQGLESLIWRLFRVRRRLDTSVENYPHNRNRVSAAHHRLMVWRISRDVGFLRKLRTP